MSKKPGPKRKRFKDLSRRQQYRRMHEEFSDEELASIRADVQQDSFGDFEPFSPEADKDDASILGSGVDLHSSRTPEPISVRKDEHVGNTIGPSEDLYSPTKMDPFVLENDENVTENMEQDENTSQVKLDAQIEDASEWEDFDVLDCECGDWYGNILDLGDVLEPELSFEELFHNEPLVSPLIKNLLSVNLIRWAIRFKVSNIAVSHLLRILKLHPDPLDFKKLPTTAKTLFDKSYVSSPINRDQIGDGVYVHYGLIKQLVQKLSKVKTEFKCVRLSFNVDGLPVRKSSKAVLWPILCKICSPFMKKKVFAVGIYYGHSKPVDVHKYLSQFMGELVPLLEKGGLDVNGSFKTIVLDNFILDAPAKSYVMQIIGHTGLCSCTTCTQRGKKEEKTGVYFPFNPKEQEERSEISFLVKEFKDFHKGETPLLPLVDYVPHFLDFFPRDPMHLCFRGVMRTLMLLWYEGRKPYKLSALQVKELSRKMLESRKTLSSVDFARRPRPFEDVHFYKATELRGFSMNTGMVVTKGILDEARYEHFLNFCVAIRILSMPKHLHLPLLTQAQTYLDDFVKQCKDLYREPVVTYNFHGLTHLSRDVKKHGRLQDFSTFDYEDYIGDMARKIRSGNMVQEQLWNRYAEEKAFEEEEEDSSAVYPVFFDFHHEDDLPYHCSGPQYKTVQFRDYKISAKSIGDSCCTLTNGKIILVSNICKSKDSGKLLLVGREFLGAEDFFTKPCRSSVVGVFLVSERRMGKTSTWPLSSIKNKNVVLPYKEELVVSSLLHTIPDE